QPLLAKSTLGIVLAFVLHVARQGIATLHGRLVVGFTHILCCVLANLRHVRRLGVAIFAAVCPRIRYLGRFQSFHVLCLGIFFTHILGIALEVVTFFLGHCVGSIGFGLGNVVAPLFGWIFAVLQLCLGYFFAALGLFFTDILGIRG